MAVATPELEREKLDKIHNERIREIYAKLIMPETKMSDLKSVEPVQQAPVQDNHEVYVPARETVQEYVPVQQVAQTVAPSQPESRFVEDARTDAEIFRADSAINRKVSFVQAEAQPVVVAQPVEEENEDLRPTSTTMQYTAENKSVNAEGTLENAPVKHRLSLTKRDKIVIAVVVSIIVTLFALIIINSAIISNLNSDLSSLQTSLNSASGAYERVTSEIADYESNFDEMLRALAESLGMIK